MTADEHFEEAERLLRLAGEYSAHDVQLVALVQRAQVHATLAVAAAGKQRTPRPHQTLKVLIPGGDYL